MGQIIFDIALQQKTQIMLVFHNAFLQIVKFLLKALISLKNIFKIQSVL